MRARSFLAVALLGMTAGGCHEPPDVVVVTPPGAYVERAPEEEGENAPQALGEMGVTLDHPSAEGEKGGSAPDGKFGETVKPAAPTKKGETKTTAGGVKYETLSEGTGPEAKPGARVTVKYVGTFDDGTTFDSGDRATFSLVDGPGGVIRGWVEGLTGMKVGEKRRLTIPPALAYGKQGSPPKIPADATLHFDVELLKAQ